MTRLPAGHWTGERAAIDILTLARKGRAFASLDSLIVGQGGQHVLYGGALVLAAALPVPGNYLSTTPGELAERPQGRAGSVVLAAGGALADGLVGRAGL